MFVAMLLSALAFASLAQALDDEGWSETVNGLQARLVVVKKENFNGTRWFVPYLEMRNVSDRAAPLEIRCDPAHLKIELLNGKGEPVSIGISTHMSGPALPLGTLILPIDSSIRVSLESRNFGVPKNAAAMVSTGGWVLEEAQNGGVFLRAILTGEEAKHPYTTWSGRIETRLQPVVW